MPVIAGLLAGLLVVVHGALVAAPAGAVADAGAGRGGGAAGRGVDSGGSAGAPRYRPPVDRPVADPFRPPANPYGPGNRGLDYATEPGDVVRVIGAGVVAFAGWVAGRGVVSVEHPDGLRSSLTGLESISLRRGQIVDAGTPAGTAGTRMHLGVRRSGRYIDPASLFVVGAPPRHAVLVPVPPA